MSTAEFLEFVTEKCDMLVSARPTAINLANIIGDLKAYLRVLFDEFGEEVLKLEDDGNRNEESEAAERKDRVHKIRHRYGIILEKFFLV